MVFAPPLLLYLATFAGALGLLMMMPQASRPVRLVGALIGAATLGAVWIGAAAATRGYGITMDEGALPFYYVFSGIAIAAGVFVIASRKPVYAALWFVMVVLASAGLFLTLAAEFMAFAMVIIYAGAILVTYMFVIMLASHSGDPQREQDMPIYDREWRNPAAAIFCGFLLLAVLLTVAFQGREPVTAYTVDDQAVIRNVLRGRSADRLTQELGPAMSAEDLARLDAITSAGLTNTERVGLDLFESHPLGLELAGVILLVALVGAVVIARTSVVEETRAIHG